MAMRTLRLRSRKARRGATALEYALVLAFVAVAVLAGMNLLGASLRTTLQTVGTNTQTAVTTGVTGGGT